MSNSEPQETTLTSPGWNLRELASQSGEKTQFVEYFILNTDKIFRYGYKDILAILSTIELSILVTLHRKLCIKTQEEFPQFRDLRPINRQVKNTVAPDIYFLGYSIVNKSPCKELEKIFVSRDNTSSLNSEELQELLQAVTSLTKKVTEVEKKAIKK